MKHIVMTTVTEETVRMGPYEFKTGAAVPVAAADAENLLKRRYPRFKEAPAAAPEQTGKKTK